MSTLERKIIGHREVTKTVDLGLSTLHACQITIAKCPCYLTYCATGLGCLSVFPTACGISIR